MRNQTTNHLGEHLNETLAKLDPQAQERIVEQVQKLGDKVHKTMLKAVRRNEDMPVEMVAIAVMKEVAMMLLGHAQADIESQSMDSAQAFARFDKMREDMAEAADLAMTIAIVGTLDSLMDLGRNVKEAETQQAA